MTTNMNFGPEWMRETTFPKQAADITFNNEFASSATESYLSFSDKSQQQTVNPYKYSKDVLLSLFKPDLPLPADFNHHEYATIDHTNTPIAFEELTDFEKKLLSGPVHSEASARKTHRHRGNDYYSSSPLQSPAAENTPNTPSGRFANRKGRSSDYFGKEQSFRRTDSGVDFLRRRTHTEESSTNRDINESLREANADGSAMGSSHGTSESIGGEPTTAGFKSDILLSGSNAIPADINHMLPSSRAPEEIKWFYRDSAGQVQGPFDAQAMQNWYKAGYFAPNLMIRRDDENIFEPLVVMCQKVGDNDKPFLMPRPSLERPSFLSGLEPNASVFRMPELQSKQMPFGVAPTNPISGIGNIFGNNLPSSLLYQQNPYNAYGGNPLLGDNRWPASNMNAAATSQPSWLNTNSNDLFTGAATNNLLSGPSPFAAQQLTVNPMFGPAMNTSNLFDYPNSINAMQQQSNVMSQYQTQPQQLQQTQQAPVQEQPELLQGKPSEQDRLVQETTSWIEGASTITQPHSQYQQSPLQQHILKNTPSGDNVATDQSSNDSPNLKKTEPSFGGWSSIPGTPVNERSINSWGSIVPAAVPSKVSEELQSKAPGAQSPRTTPSSPNKKPAEKPTKAIKTIVESFADIQLEEQRKADAIAATAASRGADVDASVADTTSTAAPTGSTKSSSKSTKENESVVTTAPTFIDKKPTAIPAPVQKPIVSLREIQEEEMRLAKERKAKQAKQQNSAVSSPAWAASNNTPVASTSTSGWAQPAAQKPLSLREIQEMEAKKAAESKKSSTVSAAQYLAHQEQAANATPSILSWGVVVPNSKSTTLNTTSTQSNATAIANNNTSASASAPWSAPSGPKKTLREIQQEEELALKKKNAKASKTSAAAIATAASANYASSTKTYAVPSAAPDGEWTTVTSSRASKPAPAPQPVTATPVKQPTTIKPLVRPAVAAPKPSGPSDEFRRWCSKTLRGSLNSGVNRDDIINMLLSFPVENSTVEIIEDVIYANSVSLDSKGFAREFMKRRKADMAGHMEIVTAGMDGFYDDDDEFKVVVTKKNKKKSTA
ncbi:hypothetical protein BDF20DRAFT_910871 [Mycotypha africana]|uniref:uncharacterized protein n=1 Tax=Mycotypha africana TaxID=64632 RepID=UPI00230113D9|nr:uncharacterized protein BDF20DRAFT_910871 [Mycotypha africana]KAI8988377.1 hypothetical protein BDF20DRAFT_910871 [Mycotypha africana]